MLFLKEVPGKSIGWNLLCYGIWMVEKVEEGVKLLYAFKKDLEDLGSGVGNFQFEGIQHVIPESSL